MSSVFEKSVLNEKEFPFTSRLMQDSRFVINNPFDFSVFKKELSKILMSLIVKYCMYLLDTIWELVRNRFDKIEIS